MKLPDRIEILRAFVITRARYISRLERDEAFRQLEESQRQLAEEVAQAARYVQSLLPEKTTTGGVAIDWPFVPSTAAGGDMFGYHWLDRPSTWRFTCSTSAAMASARHSWPCRRRTCSRRRSLPDTNFRDPGQVLSRFNDVFQMEKQNGKYFTMWYGVYEPKTRSLAFSNAGHPPALLYTGLSAAKAKLEKLEADGLAIGMIDDMPYSTTTVDLDKFARLLVYSDGVYEIQKPDGNMWQHAEFSEFITGLRAEGEAVGDRLLAHVQQLGGSTILEDDFSITRDPILTRNTGKSGRVVCSACNETPEGVCVAKIATSSQIVPSRQRGLPTLEGCRRLAMASLQERFYCSVRASTNSPRPSHVFYSRRNDQSEALRHCPVRRRRLGGRVGGRMFLLTSFGINGPLYQRIMLRKSAMAEFEPCTLFVVEPYLTLIEILGTDDPAELKKRIAEYNQLELKCNERKAYWADRLFEGPVKQALRTEVYPSVEKFFRIAKEQFLPLIEKQDRTGAKQVFDTQVELSYQEHRQAIDRAVQTGHNRTATEQQEAEQRVHSLGHDNGRRERGHHLASDNARAVFGPRHCEIHRGPCFADQRNGQWRQRFNRPRGH